jgi:hypothetical protein
MQVKKTMLSLSLSLSNVIGIRTENERKDQWEKKGNFIKLNFTINFKKDLLK